MPIPDQRGLLPDGVELERTRNGWTYHIRKNPYHKKERLGSIGCSLFCLIPGAAALYWALYSYSSNGISTGILIAGLFGIPAVLFAVFVALSAFIQQEKFGLDGDQFFCATTVWPITIRKKFSVASFEALRILDKDNKKQLTLGLTDTNYTIANSDDLEWIEKILDAILQALHHSGIKAGNWGQAPKSNMELDQAPPIGLPDSELEEDPKEAVTSLGGRLIAVAKLFSGEHPKDIAQELACEIDELKIWWSANKHKLKGVSVQDRNGVRKITKAWAPKSTYAFLGIAMLVAGFCYGLSASEELQAVGIIAAFICIPLFILAINKTVYFCHPDQLKIGYAPLGFILFRRKLPEHLQRVFLKQQLHRSRREDSSETRLMITYELWWEDSSGKTGMLAGRMRPMAHAYTISYAIANYYDQPLEPYRHNSP